MPTPSTKTTNIGGEDVFTSDTNNKGQKTEGEEVNLSDPSLNVGELFKSIQEVADGKAEGYKVNGRVVRSVKLVEKPTNTSGRMLAILAPTSEPLKLPKEKQSERNGEDFVGIANPDGSVQFVGYGAVETVDDDPKQVKHTIDSISKSASGVILRSASSLERVETKHTAQLVWGGRIEKELLMLIVIPDQHLEDMAKTQAGEALRGWDSVDMKGCRLQQIPTRWGRLQEDPVLTIELEKLQEYAVQFVHKRALQQAEKQANTSRRLPIEARQVNALSLRHRNPETRAEIYRERGLVHSKRTDKNSRQRIIVELASGVSRGKVAQLSLFQTQGVNADLGALAIEALTKTFDAFGVRAFHAILTKLTIDWGGIEWNDEGRREIFKHAEGLLTKGGESLNKSQRSRLREMILTLEHEEVLVHYQQRPKQRKTKAKRFTDIPVGSQVSKPSDRVPFVVITRSNKETGEASRVALNPEITKRLLERVGFWLPEDAWRIGDRDGGYAFTLLFTLITRWQVGAKMGWERLDKTLDGAGMLEAYERRIESEGRPFVEAWLDKLLVSLRTLVGHVEIDHKLGRVYFKNPPRWLKRKQITGIVG